MLQLRSVLLGMQIPNDGELHQEVILLLRKLKDTIHSSNHRELELIIGSLTESLMTSPQQEDGGWRLIDESDYLNYVQPLIECALNLSPAIAGSRYRGGEDVRDELYNHLDRGLVAIINLYNSDSPRYPSVKVEHLNNGFEIIAVGNYRLLGQYRYEYGEVPNDIEYFKI